MKVRDLSGFSRHLTFFALRFANILQRVFMKVPIRESPIPECEILDFLVKKRPAS